MKWLLIVFMWGQLFEAGTYNSLRECFDVCAELPAACMCAKITES